MPTDQKYSGVATLTMQQASPRLQANIANMQKGWGVRVCQVHNQTLPYNTWVWLGMDTINYNTYQAYGNSKYSLVYGAIASYPYTTVSCPYSGVYDISGTCVFGTNLNNALYQCQLAISNTGSNYSIQSIFGQEFAWGGVQSLTTSDKAYFNAGQTIGLQVNFQDSAGLGSATYGNAGYSFLSVRYMGPS